MAAFQSQNEAGLKERFFRTFQDEAKALQEQIDHLNDISPVGGERNDAVDHCLAGIDRLSHEVKDASSCIPAYDQRTYSETIKALSDRLQTIRNTFNPPKKFSFKTRKNASAISINDAAELAQSQKLRAPTLSDTSNTNSSFAPTPLDKLSPGEEKQQQEAALDHIQENGDGGIQNGTGIPRPPFLKAANVAIAGHESLHIIVPASASHAASTSTVASLRRCVVDLSAPTATDSPFAALYLKDIKDSLIICGQVAGAIHITNIENSTIVTSCRQFRMHGSKNVDIYLHSASRPIFEDCEGLRFAPLPDTFMTPAMSNTPNQWNQIDDFKWLKAEPSPHFGILPESERVKDVVWKEVVSERDRVGVDDVLRAVNRQ